MSKSVTIIDIYTDLLNGLIKKFPNGTWNYLSDAIRLVKYLIEEKLKWSDEDIRKNLNKKTFKTYKLDGMLNIVFHGSPYAALNAAYPDKFKPWELKMSPMNFWNLETGIEATKWLIEEKLRWSDNEIKQNLSALIFKEYKLSGMLLHVFNDSPYGALNAAYPNKFKAWEFPRVPLGFWNKTTGAEAIKWLIEEKLTWTNSDIKKHLNLHTFKQNGLYQMFVEVFNGSTYKAINTTYPGVFKPWELQMAPQGFWNIDTGIEATKWLFENKLFWNEQDIKQNLKVAIFVEYGLIGMLDKVFNKSPYKALNAVYPGKFKPWELVMTPKNFWTLETGIEATKWLIEEKLQWTATDIKYRLSTHTFTQNGLSTLVKDVFKGSPFQAINAAYPGRFNKQDFKTNT